MKKTVVLGIGFGDEGKGHVVDKLCSDAPVGDRRLVVRFSGANQVSHTVGRGANKRVFSNFGSGTLSGVSTYWSKFCPVNPETLLNELDNLLSNSIKPKLFVDRDSPIVTPYDVYANRFNTRNMNDGTCGHGYGTTVAREESFYHLQFADLFYPAILKEKFQAIANFYIKKDPSLDSFVTDKMKTDFLEDCRLLTTYPEFIEMRDSSIIDEYDFVVFEGSQGLLLDQHYGFFPNVTRSNTGTTNIQNWIDADTEIILVSRSYQTRHGNGFMTNENLSNNIFVDPTEVNVENAYQGKFRISLLDLDLLKYAISKDPIVRTSKKVKLAMTCLDHSKLDLRFTNNGEIEVSADRQEFLKKIKDVLGLDYWGFSDNPDPREMIVV